MLVEGIYTLAGSNVPDFGGRVERSSHKHVTFRGEVEGDNFSRVACQRGDFLASLHIPDTGGRVHRSGSQDGSMGVESQAHDFGGVAFHCGQTLAVVSVPNLGSLVERPSCYSVSERIVERKTINNVHVTGQSQKLSSGLRVPQLASSIITSCDEPYELCLQITSLVEGAIRERLLVTLESFEDLESLVFIGDHLGLEFWLGRTTVYEFDQISALVRRNEWFFLQDIIHELVDIGACKP